MNDEAETLLTYAAIFEMTRNYVDEKGRRWSVPPGEPCKAASKALRFQAAAIKHTVIKHEQDR